MSIIRIIRLTILITAGLVLGATIAAAINPRLLLPLLLISPPVSLPALPPPPTIAAERGDPPAGIVAFEERANGRLIGSGFLLALPDGDVIGVTTAHSLGEGNFAPLSFEVAHHDEVVATFAALVAPLGRPRSGDDMTIDYVIMRPDAPPDPAIVLHPDPRGAPQPGERVALYSGLGDGRGGQRVLQGTVESVSDKGAWILMDGIFDPSTMSGSPVISQHTGRVVGMTIAAMLRPGALSIGINPVGAIVEAAAR